MLDFLRTFIEMFRKCNRWLSTPRVTEYLSEIDIASSTSFIVRIMRKISSKTHPAKKNRNNTRFVTLTKFQLVFWILKSGGGISCISEFGCAVVVFWSSSSVIALWTTRVSKTALISYMLKQRGLIKSYAFCQVVILGYVLYILANIVFSSYPRVDSQRWYYHCFSDKNWLSLCSRCLSRL